MAISRALDPYRVNEVLRAIRDLAHRGITLVCATHAMIRLKRAALMYWMLVDSLVA